VKHLRQHIAVRNRYYYIIITQKKFIMKKFVFLFSIVSLFLSSCTKNEDVEEKGATNAQQAELRLGSASKWVISDFSQNGTFIIKDKVLLDLTQTGLLEWLKFDTTKKNIEVKYGDEIETSFFNYKIDGDVFSVTEPNDPEYVELMTIKAGSVFENSFTLEQMIDDEVFVIKLVKE
jgi:hypothetical protein